MVGSGILLAGRGSCGEVREDTGNVVFWEAGG